MDSHSYPKGAAILHTLRFVMGDEPFFRALKEFLTAYACRSVDTHDLMTTIKEATGQNLDWFFDQWVYKAGHPVFDVSWTWDEAAGRASVRVVQTQDTAKAVAAYRTPIMIGLVLPDKAISEKVWITKREETFAFPAARKPLLVRFDEGNWLMKEAKVARSLDELLFQLKSDDALGRMSAAGELGGRLDAPGVAEALAERAKADPFWAVRKAAIESLAKGGEAGAAAPIFKGRCLDASSKVRAAALRAVGNLKDRRLVSFLEERFTRDDSYVAQSEALAAIGKTGDASAENFLRKASGIPSPRNMLRRSAEAALKALGAGLRR
jgi:aminopeptidase N